VRAFGPQRVANDLLHRRHHVRVGDAVPQPRLQRGRRVRGDERRRVADSVEVLDDRGRLGQDHAGHVVDQHRHAGHRPQRREPRAALVALDQRGHERHAALVERDQRLPAVRSEGMLVQRERQRGTCT
jgi:hypothetical protein